MKAIKRLGVVSNHKTLPKVKIISIVDEFHNDGSCANNAIDALPDTPNASPIDVTATPIAMAAASTRPSSNGDDSASTNSLSRKKVSKA